MSYVSIADVGATTKLGYLATRTRPAIRDDNMFAVYPRNNIVRVARRVV
jgi:hypothetical protein